MSLNLLCLEERRRVASFFPWTFALREASRVAPIRDRCEEGRAERDAAFLDCWFGPAARERLVEAANNY